MTSNAGAQRIVSPKHLGFGNDDSEEADYKKMKESVMEEVKRIFKPEFINRIDEVLVFHMLTEENIREIVKIMINALNKRTNAQMSISLDVTEEAISYLAKNGFDKNYGARPIRRAIQTHIEDELADRVLDGTVKPGDTVRIDCKDDKIVISLL